MFNQQKMDDYFANFIEDVIENRAQLEAFLKASDTLSKEDKEYLRDVWEIETLNVPEDEDDDSEVY